MKLLFLFLTLVFISNHLLAQVTVTKTDFNNYKGLQAVGERPSDFSKPTSEKVKQADRGRYSNLTKAEKEEFIIQTQYNIDELLHQGSVVYGDLVSNYIQKIGDRLTENDSDLKDVFRYYTLVDNQANAFSTDQGIIFVTTGLIAQLTNEAQLAFVLSHEIMHYKEKHVLDFYDYRTDNKKFSNAEKMRFFTKYSRENESEADLAAVKMYHAAGYSEKEINRTFDVLLYSYLPFEELPFPKNYFNTEHLFVPESVFSNKKNDISYNDDFDDRLRSHPNERKRKEALTEECTKFKDWKDTVFFDESLFYEVRNICRFEYLRAQIQSVENVNALYSIFVLEQVFPESIYLKRCKAQVWLFQMAPEKRSFSYDLPFNFYSRMEEPVEGQISVLQNFMDKLEDDSKKAIGLRIISDLYKGNESDSLLKKMYHKSVEIIAKEKFIIADYSNLTFSEAATKLIADKKTADSLALNNKETLPKWDKYKTLESLRAGISDNALIDSSKFHLYALSDLVSDSTFLKLFEASKKKELEKEMEDEDFFNMTDDEQFEQEDTEYETRMNHGADSVIFVSSYTSYRSRKGNLFHKTDKLVQNLERSAEKSASEVGVEFCSKNLNAYDKMSTDEYNQLRLLNQSVAFSNENNYLSEFYLLDEDARLNFVNNNKTQFVVLTETQHRHNVNLGPGIVLFSILLPPIGIFVLPQAIAARHQTDYKFIIYDMKSGKRLNKETYITNESVKQKSLEARFYAIFSSISKQKDND